MKNRPNLIVMLTYNDRTVRDAFEIFDRIKDSKANIWGFKEEGISFDEMKKLFYRMKECGKTTVLEVVTYTEKEGLEGAKKAVECNCDFLMGTLFFDSINDFCKENNLKYMPFVGQVSGRPSILEGDLPSMISEAKKYLSNGVYGIDLLGYRYSGNSSELNQNFVSRVNAPVCIAGSVNSYQRIDEIKATGTWAFTIGGAFFEKIFGEDFATQINNVCNYIER